MPLLFAGTIHRAARSIHGNLTGLNIRTVRVCGGRIRLGRISHRLRRRLRGHLRRKRLLRTHWRGTHLIVQRKTAHRRLRRIETASSLHRLIRTVVPLGSAFLRRGNRLRNLNRGAVGARQRTGRTNNLCMFGVRRNNFGIRGFSVRGTCVRGTCRRSFVSRR